MDIKGVCYDVGRAYSGYFLTRRVFDPATTRRELQIIRERPAPERHVVTMRAGTAAIHHTCQVNGTLVGCVQP